MKEETKQPLYKVLNEQRTQGEWAVGKPVLTESNAVWVGGTIIAKMAEVPHEGSEVNAQYTALAVNNLHHLAEALQSMLNVFDRGLPEGSIGGPTCIKAKEALNRIS